VDALSVPTPVPRLQVTPVFDASFTTVAVKVWVALPPNATVVGLTATLIGAEEAETVIDAEADLVLSDLLVAVRVTAVDAAKPVGAV
jgi:hypothetical protein